MRVVLFCHSLISDWNHGNAHFLRGVIWELKQRRHKVCVYEPRNAWSVENLLAEHGDEPVRDFHRAYPGLMTNRYDLDSLDLDEVLDGADLVIVHEWNAPELVARIGRHRRANRRYTLLFHDTHHRSVTKPDEMKSYDLRDYDGVLVFGARIGDRYRELGWHDRTWTWHEAADTRIFHPMQAPKQRDVVWIGNWGDDERTAELHEFLIEPVRDLGLAAAVHGVRYPVEARSLLDDAGIDYRGWIPNFQAPVAFAQARMTVHVPRRAYANALPGIPTIRMFEALACGIPLISAPWNDIEGLFTPGKDFLVARNGKEMLRLMKTLTQDAALAEAISRSGQQKILERHTCAQRVDELMEIVDELHPVSATVPASPRARTIALPEAVL